MGALAGAVKAPVSSGAFFAGCCLPHPMEEALSAIKPRAVADTWRQLLQPSRVASSWWAAVPPYCAHICRLLRRLLVAAVRLSSPSDCFTGPCRQSFPVSRSTQSLGSIVHVAVRISCSCSRQFSVWLLVFVFVFHHRQQPQQSNHYQHNQHYQQQHSAFSVSVRPLHSTGRQQFGLRTACGNSPRQRQVR